MGCVVGKGYLRLYTVWARVRMIASSGIQAVDDNVELAVGGGRSVHDGEMMTD